MSPLDLLGLAARGDEPALHLEAGHGTDTAVTYRGLHELIAARALTLHRHRLEAATGRPAADPLLAVEQQRPARLLVELLAALEAGWPVLAVNGGWWPRERDATFERLRPAWVATGDDPTAPPTPTGLEPRRTAADSVRPALWLASVGTDGDPTPYAFTAGQVGTWLAAPGPSGAPGPFRAPPAAGHRVVITGEVGHAPVLRAVLDALAAGAEVELTDRTHLAGLLAQRPCDRLVTTPVLLRRSLRQLDRRGRRPAGAAHLVLHQGAVRPHEPGAWRAMLGSTVEDRVSATEAGGWLVQGGTTAPGVDLHLDDAGSVHCAGPHSAIASADRPRPEPGWAGGDVAETADGGRIVWRGRRRDRFVVDGTDVDPVEVEAALAAHPLVAEVAVAPRPHAGRGNLVVAVLVPADPEWPPFLEDLAEVADRLPSPARPAALAIVDDVPVNAAGALHRRLVNYEEAGR